MRRARLLAATVVFVASLAVYALTLAPTVTLVDSGELIVAARTLGVAHPPGFPLYVLLAHGATRVPIGNVAMRVNAASALFAALATAGLTLLATEALLTPSCPRTPPAEAEEKRGRRRGAKRSPEVARAGVPSSPSHPRPAWLVLVPALVSGLLLAFSRTLWAYATLAEVYALNTLLVVVIFYLTSHWRRRIVEDEARGRESARMPGASSRSHRGPATPRASYDRPLYVAAFVFGLALGVHHVTIGLMLPALALLVYATEGPGFFRSKRLIYTALCAFAGLAVYGYLPLAASRSPLMNWGDPRTVERLWWHVTGRQYQVFFSFSPERVGNELGDFLTRIAREFGPWGAPVALTLALAGFRAMFRRHRTTFWFLALVVAADLLYNLNYEIAEDKDAYYLPVFISVAMAAGFGAQWVIEIARRARRLPGHLRRGGAAVAVLLVPITALAGNLPYNDRSRYFIAQDYVENIFSTIGLRGMLLTLDWQVYSPMLYFREIEERRRDVIAIDVNLLRRSWYFDYLNRAYPELIEKTRGRVDAFLEDLRRWEREPDAYARDVALRQRINSRFYDMILAFVGSQIREAPVYVTQDVALARVGQDPELTTALAAAYQFVPQGLVFQLVVDRGFREPAEPRLLTRGLADGTLKFAKDDVVTLKILPVYVNMLVNRGRYLAAHGHHPRATAALKEALALDPSFKPAQQSLTESLR